MTYESEEKTVLQLFIILTVQLQSLLDSQERSAFPPLGINKGITNFIVSYNVSVMS